MTRNQTVFIKIIAFPALVIIQCSMFFMLPLLVPFVTGAAIAIYGIIISFAVLRRFWSKRGVFQTLAVGLLTISWLGWIYTPTHEFAIHVRFWLEKSTYEHVAAQIARGEKVDCLAAGDCILAGNDSPYIVFPFPGFLSAWIGVVRVPQSGNPSIERLKSVATEPDCDPTPIAPHYYICVFY